MDMAATRGCSFNSRFLRKIPSRHPSDLCTRIDILSRDAARSNHGTVANCNSLKNDDTSSDPDVATNSNRTRTKQLLSDQLPFFITMIMVCNVTMCTDHTVFANHDFL